jgi:hypothetical protein
MKTASLLIIRLALAVQFAGVLAVPTLLAAGQSPRGTWMAEWLRPQTVTRTLGVLTLRDNKLAFQEQAGAARWELELENVKRVAPANDGQALTIVTIAGEEYVVAIMDPSLNRTSPKRALTVIERALQLQAANRR